MATNNNQYRVIKTWDDEDADWVYRLEIDSGDGEGWQATVYSGDGNWAINQVEHYKCGILQINEDGSETVVLS
jgi:hypothetical protein